MIRSLLIANRGEIACRIIRTARAMGIRTIAVYSDADATALHVRQADEAVHIGPSPAAESYLVGERIVAAAKQTGAEAIHPGYGFLSENADFAQSVLDSGLIWVGPRPESIRAMGLKDAAKKLMEDAGVPVTPGYLGEDQSPETLRAEADRIGYPVLIKAVAGGGGKGMRKVDNAQQFLEMLQSCQREAKASFGNMQVLLEKWITSPRHIEVQIFGDSHGNVLHLFERDCSLQRRHQKVIEEAPAPGMDEATREAICAAAVRAAKAVDYVGAGTVEFIADASDGLDAERIFFMEMNTRLQVEHPVTEEITGVDLVEWQLRVASGEELPRKQEELSINGHAIEARLYAEDPAKGFLPSTGRLDILQLPHGARVETGVAEGSEISPFYDPMIAKIVVHRHDRAEAVEAMETACRTVAAWPVKNNAWFLARLMRMPEYDAGTMTTGSINDHIDALTAAPAPSGGMIAAAAEAAFFDHVAWENSSRETGLMGFRLNAPRRAAASLTVEGERVDACIDIDLAQEWRDERIGREDFGNGIFAEDGATFALPAFRADGGGAASAHDGDILAPMPGKVIAVDVAEGDMVEAGQRLMVLEAMKMEHALTAPFSGTVAELAASEGAQVQVEALLARIESAEKVEN
ncbi:3-methylcrotonyl-CoA carboxylase alpha subunit [Altererythrobacter atlanticus]|uniref:Acetyl-/propionyl-coenzyme A carboxylase alpha chain n=1 Tax=Croceibacterium atlanticum TaxID=1267766 RepID=A0A0F7KXR9_9SPHN|nr:biotin carboxylase N-terminal domain-containing protein [Croceibacterium atlanticum]AKH44036.1 Acetyl-/propionyl-coenzyme A carboxylase alpha chain [Croceibacterium atlanticum]MBB5732343.1 3-methylcrotonyl-CoA carboxylase alpha subunit [Croceibacterium atlanticum]